MLQLNLVEAQSGSAVVSQFEIPLYCTYTQISQMRVVSQDSTLGPTLHPTIGKYPTSNLEILAPHIMCGLVHEYHLFQAKIEHI